jgi:hypothetical protein
MVERTGVMATGGKNPGTWKRLCPNASATNTNSTLIGLGMNPRLLSETLATNHLTLYKASDVRKIGCSELAVNLKRVRRV